MKENKLKKRTAVASASIPTPSSPAPGPNEAVGHWCPVEKSRPDDNTGSILTPAGEFWRARAEAAKGCLQRLLSAMDRVSRVDGSAGTYDSVELCYAQANLLLQQATADVLLRDWDPK